MNINNIKDETIAKLTNEEAQVLGLANIGFGFYKGELKTRYNGMKRVAKNEKTFVFEGTHLRAEFTKLADEEERPCWAMRIFNKERNGYETYPMGIYGVYFLRA